MSHSNIVGGSTAKRVIKCPGSVKLCQQVPPKPSSSYADTGTLLHNAIAQMLSTDATADQVMYEEYNGISLTPELFEEKIVPAIQALNAIDPNQELEYAVEQTVSFGDLLPGVFGSCDIIGRLGDRAVILDWKFGDGVAVEVEENAQLLFYAAAAMRTPETQWVFKNATEVELIIVQPPSVKRWTTTVERIKQFEDTLVRAVKVALQPDAPLAAGDHCRWCAAKPLCPVMTGAIDRVARAKIDALPVEQIAHYLEQIPAVEAFLKDLQQLAHGLMEEGKAIPGWKLVNKRATRQWTDEAKAAKALLDLGIDPYKMMSPAGAEKVLKKAKRELPADLVVAVSSGSTIAPESDPRPAVVQIGQTLRKALAKVQ